MKWFKQKSQRDADLSRMSDEELDQLNNSLSCEKEAIRNRQKEINVEVTKRYYERDEDPGQEVRL